MTIVGTWQSDGTKATVRDDADDLWAELELVDDWYPAGERQSISAWVVSWLEDPTGQSGFARRLLMAEPIPAPDERARAVLTEDAARLARGMSEPAPEPFGAASTGGDWFKRIELISHAIQSASGRLGDAATQTEEWSADLVLIALTETLGWVRALDDSMTHLWRRTPDSAMATVTAKIDQTLRGPGWDPHFVEWARSKRRGSSYDDWTLGLIPRSGELQRGQLLGIRWLAGKMLHFGPLPAAELAQRRAGEPPRWKWRSADVVFPTRSSSARADANRVAYAEHLEGRSILSTFDLFNALLAAEFLALDLSQPRAE